MFFSAMSYTKALYYPTIDIPNEEWLKNAILFWDEISTIVPESIKQPYSSKTSLYLQEEGILKPFIVSGVDEVVQELDEKIYKFSESNFSIKMLNRHVIRSQECNQFSNSQTYLHKDKLSFVVQDNLRMQGLIHEDGYISFDKNFADYYMSLLATNISKHNNLCLLTDSIDCHDLSTGFSLEKATGKNNMTSLITRKLADGFLYHLVVEGLKVSDKTDISKLVEFKRNRKDELGRFRSALSEMSLRINTNDIESIKELKNVVESTYINEFLPALQDVKKSLKDKKIRWISNVGSYVLSFLTPTFMISDAKMSSLLAGLVICSASWKLSDFAREKDLLRSNPFSYLLSLEKNGIIK